MTEKDDIKHLLSYIARMEAQTNPRIKGIMLPMCKVIIAQAKRIEELERK